MVQQGQITFYSSEGPIFCHRVRIALEEAQADYTFCDIDLRNKPEWYTKVNPLGRIPAITYGGPTTAPDDPSPESAKLVESIALVEFIAELFPESGLYPADPVLRARARALNLWFDAKFFIAYKTFCLGGAPEGSSLLVSAVETLQTLLAPEGFAIGPWSFADAVLAPFVLRVPLFLQHDLGKYPAGEGRKTFEALQDARFARFWKYVADIADRPSIKATYNEEETLGIVKTWSILNRDVN